jgi:hypothetical protein
MPVSNHGARIRLIIYGKGITNEISIEEDINIVKATLSRAKFQFNIHKCIKVKSKHYMNCETNKVLRL